MAMLEIYTIFRKIKMKKFSMTGMHKMVTIHGINETLTKKIQTQQVITIILF